METSGQGSWQSKEATIYSAEWIDPQGEERGCWQVTYSYRVGEEYYSGKFTDWSSADISSYRKNETLSIEYSIEDPSRSRVPGITRYWDSIKIPVLIGAAFALIVMIIVLLSGGFK
jgi:Protein of unknown function (DUF3592)